MTKKLTTPNTRFTREQAAAYLGLSEATLAGWASSGKNGPPMVKVSATCVRYLKADLDAWTDSKKVTPAGQAPEAEGPR